MELTAAGRARPGGSQRYPAATAAGRAGDRGDRGDRDRGDREGPQGAQVSPVPGPGLAKISRNMDARPLLKFSLVNQKSRCAMLFWDQTKYFVNLKSNSTLLYNKGHNLLTSAFPPNLAKFIKFPLKS